jgi:hypothetical protein
MKEKKKEKDKYRYVILAINNVRGTIHVKNEEVHLCSLYTAQRAFKEKEIHT